LVLAIRADVSLNVLADAIQPFPTYGEVLDLLNRALAGLPI
jgi:hypothetical protein